MTTFESNQTRLLHSQIVIIKVKFVHNNAMITIKT